MAKLFLCILLLATGISNANLITGLPTTKLGSRENGKSAIIKLEGRRTGKGNYILKICSTFNNIKFDLFSTLVLICNQHHLTTDLGS